MPKIFTYQDQAVLAGLTWGPGKPSGFLRRGPLSLTWEDRMALVPEKPEYLDKASLLSVLMGRLSQEDRIDRIIGCRVICAIADNPADDPATNDPTADDTAGLFFAAVLVNGKPAIGAERLFDTRAELIDHIELECSSGQIDRLATTADLASEIHAAVPVSQFMEQAVGSLAVGSSSAPVCVEGRIAPKRPVWQIAAGGGAALLTLTAGILLLFPFQPSKPAVSAPRIAAVQTTFRDEAAFGQGCLAAFAGDWPLAPGWQLTSEGCATPEMRDPNLVGIKGLAPNHAVAYRIYQVRGGFDDAIARKAARAVYAESAVHMEIRGNRLYSSSKIAVPMLTAQTATDQSAPVSLSAADLLAATEAVFLGLADSIVLDGGGNGGSGPKVRVTLKSRFEEIFERVARVEGAEIARLSRSGKTVTLEITTRQIVMMPMFLPISGLKTSHGKSAEKNTAQRGAAMQAVLPSAASHELDAAAETQKDKMI